jgi:hypothetical protein
VTEVRQVVLARAHREGSLGAGDHRQAGRAGEMVEAGVGLLGLLRRWRRGGPAVAIAPAGTAAADAYDARLDAELSELE